MGIQFHDKENHSYEENERCNIIFLYQILSFHFPEAIKEYK